MSTLPVHTAETAPEGSQPVLYRMQKDFGFIPNLTGIFAESPAMAEGYWALADIYEKTTLTATEREVVLMTNNQLNKCHYCSAAHTMAAQMKKIPNDVIEALRNGTPIADPRLEALHVFARRINEARGWVSNEDVQSFLSAGFTKANILDVILGTSLKVMSNYSNHIAQTPLDEPFKPHAIDYDANAAA